jgi:anti-anti-sigma factor
MSFDASLGFAGPTATIRLSGTVDERGASALRGLLDQAGSRSVRHVRLEVDGLESLGSAGARCVAFAQQQLPPGTEISLHGASRTVREALRAAGLTNAVTDVEHSVVLDDAA